MKIRHNIFMLLFFSFCLLACEAPEQSLSTDELKLVDSLFNLQKDSIELDMDDLCDSIFLENYDQLVDSLRHLRQKEILDIISK